MKADVTVAELVSCLEEHTKLIDVLMKQVDQTAPILAKLPKEEALLLLPVALELYVQTQATIKARQDLGLDDTI